MPDRHPFTCPHCKAPSSGRILSTGTQLRWIYRRRECEHCEGRYSTHERLCLADDGAEHAQVTIEDGGRAVDALVAVRDVLDSVGDLVR